MKLMRAPFSAIAWTALVGLAVLGGCGGPKVPIGIKTVKPIRTAVSLCPSAAEILMIGTPRVIGRSKADNFPPSILAAPVVADVKPDYERIAELKPDVIVYDPSVYNAQDVEKLKALNIPLATIEGDSVDEYIKSVFKLGQATMSETGFMDYIERLRKEVEVCRTDPLTPAPKTVVLMPMAKGNPWVAGTKSYYADLVRVAGADPVGPETNKFQEINAEALMALSPDAIVVAVEKGKPDGITTDPRFTQLKAVKTGKVMVMDQDYILRRGERTDVALQRLHDALIKLFKESGGKS